MKSAASKALAIFGALALVFGLTAAGPAVYTGSFNAPSGATLKTSVPLTANSGTNLVLNVTSSTGGVSTDFGDSGSGGLKAFDGGSTNYASLRGLTGLTFSSGATQYAYNLATVAGPVTATLFNGSGTGLTGVGLLAGNQTFTGSNTFNSGNTNVAGDLNVYGSNGVIELGTSGVDNTSGGVYIGTGAGTWSQLSVNSGVSLGTVPCNLFGIANLGNGYKVCIDTTGNLATSGDLEVGLSGIYDGAGHLMMQSGAITTQIHASQATGSAGEVDFGNLSSDTAYGKVDSGGYHNPSMRKLKYAIQPYQQDALSLIDRTTTAQFCYRDPAAVVQHTCNNPIYGVIADDSPWPIASNEHTDFQSTQATAVLIRSVQELHSQVIALQRELRAIKDR